MEDIIYIDNFIDNSIFLFSFLYDNLEWDETMLSRKTASFGKAYNYSQIQYDDKEFIPELKVINEKLVPVIGFESNNCLINYYMDGNSKMGYHSDQIDILEENTGIAIISLGEARVLKFRNIIEPSNTEEFLLNPGSLIYMTQRIQNEWQHAIPKSNTENGRISLTFRKII